MDSEMRACEIVASALKLQQPVSADDTMESLQGWDSLSHITLVTGIEEYLNRQLSPEEIVSILSVRSVARIIENGAASNGSQ